MYDLIDRLINHSWVTGNSEQQYIFYACCAIIIILTVVIVDLIYRCISHFWR